MLRSLLLGPAYFRHRWLIAESRIWSPGDITEYQAQAMRPLRRRYGQFTTTSKADYRANPGYYRALRSAPADPDRPYWRVDRAAADVHR